MSETEIEAACAARWETIDGGIEVDEDEGWKTVRLSVLTVSGQRLGVAYRFDLRHPAYIDPFGQALDRLVREIEKHADRAGEVIR